MKIAGTCRKSCKVENWLVRRRREFLIRNRVLTMSPSIFLATILSIVLVTATHLFSNILCDRVSLSIAIHLLSSNARRCKQDDVEMRMLVELELFVVLRAMLNERLSAHLYQQREIGDRLSCAARTDALVQAAIKTG